MDKNNISVKFHMTLQYNVIPSISFFMEVLYFELYKYSTIYTLYDINTPLPVYYGG